MVRLNCGHTLTKVEGVGTGYAIVGSGEKVCYDCSLVIEKAEMCLRDTYYGYLSLKQNAAKKWYEITNWTGGTLCEVTEFWGIGHNWYPYYLVHWRGIDEMGRQWYGKCSGDGMCTTMHRAKGEVDILSYRQKIGGKIRDIA
jgi:hypothetical protein